MRAFAVTLSVCIGILSVVARAQNPPAQTAPSSQPPCVVSDDAEFGATMNKPIRVGGGAMYVAARERRYLDALRGPAGQPIAYKRLGSTAPTPNGGPLDHYQVTYEGLAAPISLYLDAYHFEDPKAPRGFTCVPFTLGSPPVDGFLATEMLVRLAIEQGAVRDFAPISLDADGSAAKGVAFDRFRMIARASKAASVAGAPMDPKNPPRNLPGGGLILFAYSLKCGERVVAPVSIDIVPSQGAAVGRQGAVLSGEAAAKLVPGFDLPAGAIGAVFQLGQLRPIDTVRITYAEEVCAGGAKEAMLPVKFAAARPASLPQPPLPAGAAPGQGPVWLQVIVDVDGMFQQPQYIGGPDALLQPALATIKGWRAEPARLNGSPIVADTLLLVNFK